VGRIFEIIRDAKLDPWEKPLTVPGEHGDFVPIHMLNPEKYAHTAAIERLQPYDPNNTIVLVIHGLMDSQATAAKATVRIPPTASCRIGARTWTARSPSALYPPVTPCTRIGKPSRKYFAFSSSMRAKKYLLRKNMTAVR
jgi:hypothetical protein